MHQDPAFKTDANGRPCLKASYIMKRNPDARAAYDAIRRRGATAKEAAATIERTFQHMFTETLLAEVYEEGERGEIARDRRRSLAQPAGRAAGEEYFPRPTAETQTELAIRASLTSGSSRPNCLHLVKADMRAPRRDSGFDPNRKSRGQFCCDAQQPRPHASPML
jgi:hypothetical protein